MSKLDKYLKFLPKELKPNVNPMLRAIVEAFAGADAELETQIDNAKAQLFVKTAEGTYLDRLASNFGVTRPAELGLLDEDFQQLIPNLSLKQKQIAKSFYDTMDVFWGPLFSRANVTGTLAAPYNLVAGDTIKITIDGNKIGRVTIRKEDLANPGAATPKEVLRILARIAGITASVVEDVATGDQFINVRTNTPGSRGSIEIDSSESFAGLGLETGRRIRITDIDQRTVLYQINPGEVIIELPAVVPTLRRTLKGSHHFHADSTIESAVPPENGIWQGSFLYSTLQQPFVVTQRKAILDQQVLKNSIVNQLTVLDSSMIPATSGKLIFNFGKENQEQPVNYITVTNSQTILIDPSHEFQFSHAPGSEINVLLEGQTTPYQPRKIGTDLAVYLTSPANARTIVEELLKTLTAAGITVKFVVLLPAYKYLFDNPYET